MLLDFVTIEHQHLREEREALSEAITLWRHASRLLRMKVYQPGEKLEAMEVCKSFVKCWAERVHGSVTQYMHLLYDHADWFFNTSAPHDDEGDNIMHESVSWWTTQALEAAHGLRKQVFRTKTMHGKPMTYTMANGTKVEISTAPGIYQIFLWHWRGTAYQIMVEREAAKGRGWSELDVQDLNLLEWLGDEVLDKEFDEVELIELFDYPPGNRIKLHGRGVLTIPVKVRVGQSTIAAKDKVAKASKEVNGIMHVGKVTATAGRCTGKRCAADRPEQYAKERAAKAAKASRVSTAALTRMAGCI
jgi:hypothetical protein